MRLRIAALSVALLAIVVGSLPAAAASTNLFENPKHYDLSLGDSIAFGYQQAKFNALFPNEDPASFDTGYANDFAASLRNGGIELVNYGCPGETTWSFINGPCPYPFALHNAYSRPSQLATAVAFLHAHPDQVSPITIDIGSNDATQALEPVCLDPRTAQACAAAVATLLPQIARNLTTILTALHSASPRSEIIVLDLYNPLAVLAASSDQIATLINGTIRTVVESQGARLADVFGSFNPVGPSEVPTLCALTGICTALQDTHPSDAGYAVIADKLMDASTYRPLGD